MNEGKGKKMRKLHKKWIKRPYNCNVIEMYKYDVFKGIKLLNPRCKLLILSISYRFVTLF